MEDEELKYYRQQWRKADKDGSGTLDKKEVACLAQQVRALTSDQTGWLGTNTSGTCHVLA